MVAPRTPDPAAAALMAELQTLLTATGDVQTAADALRWLNRIVVRNRAAAPAPAPPEPRACA